MKQREKRAQERTVDRAKAAEPKDELYHFFMYMYQITKKMSPMYQHFARTAVFNAISQVEAQSLQINVHTSQQTYVQPSYPQHMQTSRTVVRPEEQHGYQRPWTSRPISSNSDNSDQISSVSNVQFATDTNSQWSTVSMPMTSPEDRNLQESATGNLRNFLQNFSAGFIVYLQCFKNKLRTLKRSLVSLWFLLVVGRCNLPNRWNFVLGREPHQTALYLISDNS
ncbi:hypothetical protein JTB14_036692 [Gonioctena quinquepunctata]|nr:hypothetical protein JTB14_036692 [Gonioctena quinquepunctata]